MTIKEVLSPKDKEKIRKARAKKIIAKEGILIIPKKSRSQKFREFVAGAKKAGHTVVEEEEEIEKALKDL